MTKDKIQRQIKSLKEGYCRDIVLEVATLKEDNYCHDRRMRSRQGMDVS